MSPGIVPWVWLGIVLGVAFVATPIKFAAPSLDLSTALEVGRVTFHLLARVEWVLGIGLLITTWTSRRSLPWSAFIVFAIVGIESIWLLPALGARTDVIVAGGRVAPSPLHNIFIAGKALECLALGHAGFVLSRRRGPQAS